MREQIENYLKQHPTIMWLWIITYLYVIGALFFAIIFTFDALLDGVKMNGVFWFFLDQLKNPRVYLWPYELFILLRNFLFGW